MSVGILLASVKNFLQECKISWHSKDSLALFSEITLFKLKVVQSRCIYYSFFVDDDFSVANLSHQMAPGICDKFVTI